MRLSGRWSRARDHLTVRDAQTEWVLADVGKEAQLRSVQIATSTSVDVSRRFQQRSWTLSVESIRRVETDLNQIGRIVVLFGVSTVDVAVANRDGIVSWQCTRSHSAVEYWTLLFFGFETTDVAGIVVVL